MLPYNPSLKMSARRLRGDLTDAEQKLWPRLRRKQVLGVQFYRQKPLLGYVADFYCAAAELVIELDGGQHLEPTAQAYDMRRTRALETLGLRVLRFDNLQVLKEIEAVMAVVHAEVAARLAGNPPCPPFSKGG